MDNSDQPSASHFPLTKNYSKADAAETFPPQPVKITATRRSRPRSTWTYIKWTSGTLLCVMCMAAGAIVGNFYSRSPIFKRIVDNIVNHPFASLRDPLASFTHDQQFPDRHVINVVLLGCDHDYEDRRPVAIKNARGRSDSIILLRIDFDRKTIKAMSIPRDTAVRIPDHGLHKINAAHAIGGPELTMATIKSVFGIDTDYYVTLDFEGFQKVVDAVGGVDINVEKQLDYDDNWGHLHVHLKPGFQHLNGYRAMGYVRMRHSDNDLMRAERQHAFLESLRSQVKSRDNFLKLPDVLNAITDSVKTNLTEDQLLTLGNFARTLPKENIALTTLPVIEGPSYVYVKVAPSAEMIRKIFYDDSPVAQVEINVPAYSVVRGLGEGHRSRHRKRRGDANADATTPKDDNGDPLDSSDEMLPADGSGASDGSATDNGATGTRTDTGSGTEKKRDGGDKDKSDGAGPGSPSDKSEGAGSGAGNGDKPGGGDKGDKDKGTGGDANPIVG